MGLVTVFCPLTTTGPGETLVQTGETRFVVHCKLNPPALVGQVKRTFAPEGMIASCGGLTDPNERLNIEPEPELLPSIVVPYRVLPDWTNPRRGLELPLLVPGEGPESASKM